MARLYEVVIIQIQDYITFFVNKAPVCLSCVLIFTGLITLIYTNDGETL